MKDMPLDTVAFAERLLALLEEGSFTATYKFAVLLGLMDLCLEGTTKSGEPPQSVTTVQLAEKILELYWRQVSHYDDSGFVLEQNAGHSRRKSSGLSAKIPRFIAEFRIRHGAGLTLFEARHQAPLEFNKLLRRVEWTLVEMPLPKLQRFGKTEDCFAYRIAWDDTIRQGTWSRHVDFDNRIKFVGEAASHFVRLSSLLRPLIQQQWARKVAGLNRLKIDRLESFLFGSDRAALTRVARPLLELADRRCFYCRVRIEAKGPIHVDHFIPWCRHPDDGIDNLVASHSTCNTAKRNFLAGHDHLQHWMERASALEDELQQLATGAGWPRDKVRTHGTVRAAYLRTVSSGQRLWRSGREFEPADHSRLVQTLAS